MLDEYLIENEKHDIHQEEKILNEPSILDDDIIFSKNHDILFFEYSD